MYTHYGHFKSIHVKVGQVVPAGYIIGSVGDSGAPGNSHLHFEVWKDNPSGQWSAYTSGMSKEDVQQKYKNPHEYLQGKQWPLSGGTADNGYDWLDKTAQGVYHPGIDLNVGSGFDDYGLPVIAVEYSEVIYVDAVDDDGWGNHVFLKPINKPKQDKQMIKLLERRRCVWIKPSGESTGEFWVIRTNDEHPLEVRQKVKGGQSSEVAALFGSYGKLQRVEWPEIQGLKEGKEFDVHDLALTHPEYFESV